MIQDSDIKQHGELRAEYDKLLKTKRSVFGSFTTTEQEKLRNICENVYRLNNPNSLVFPCNGDTTTANYASKFYFEVKFKQ